MEQRKGNSVDTDLRVRKERKGSTAAQAGGLVWDGT